LALQGADIYMITVSLSSQGPKARQMRVTKAALDTAAGAVLVNPEVLPMGVIVRGVSEGPRIIDASGRRLLISGITEMEVTISGLVAQTEAWLVPNLPVPLLLGTPFLDRYTHAILPREKTVWVRDPDTEDRWLVPLLKTPKREKDVENSVALVRSTADVCIPPFTEQAISVQCDRVGLSLVTPIQRRRSPAFVANGLIELPVEGTTNMLVANFSEEPLMIRRGRVLGKAEKTSPILVAGVEDHGDADSFPSVNAAIKDLELEVSDEIRPKVLKMLKNHARLWGGRLGQVRGVEHRIPTVGHPSRQQPYRCGLKTREAVEDEIKRMLDLDVIEPATSEWAAPIVLIPKPDGSLRFCIDYRRLNALTVRDSYPLPRMDDCLDSLATANIFSTLDANSGYWQLNVAEADRDKTAFTSHRGTYRFKRMPFGLINAPATFQRAMDVLLSRVLWKTAIVYLDDVIVFSKTVEDHIREVDDVLTILESAGVSLNMKKCHLFRSRVDYLGHVVRPGKLAMSGKKVTAVVDWPLPRNKTEVRSFVAFCSVYRRFVPAFARIAGPLNEALRKEAPEAIDCNPRVIQAFADLKNRMTSAPVLTLPRLEDALVLETDASDSAIGAVLLVRNPDGTENPAAFLSRSLSGSERNYSATEREALAVVWATKQTRPYLERKEFVIRTDHAALRWMFATATENPRVCRWRLSLSEFHFVVEHRSGRTHVAPDCLSRLPARAPVAADAELEPPVLIVEIPVESPPTKSRGRALLELVQPLPNVTVEMLYREQSLDPWCRSIAERAEIGLSGYSWSAEGLLVKESTVPGQDQILVPTRLREPLLHLAHLPPQGAHPGTKRMVLNLARQFIWPSMARDCAKYVSECISCAASKPSFNRRSRPLQLFPPNGPWEFICADILGPLPTTKSGNRFILVISDRFSKFTVARPLRTTSANDVAECIVADWIANFGVPLILLTDNGPQFASKFLQQVSAVMGVHQRFTSAYHPATNGQVERFNRTVLAMLSHYVGASTDWDKVLGPTMAAYNSTVHSSTGFAPHEFVRTTAPRVLTSPPNLCPLRDKGEWRREFLQRSAAIGAQAKETLERQQERYRKAYDAHVKLRNAKVKADDFVFVRVYADSPKLTLPLAGPFRVHKVDDRNGTFIVETREGLVRVANDRVRPAPIPRDLPEGVILTPQAVPTVPDEGTKYVIDRIVSHGRSENDEVIMRVRWSGYSDADDTWERVDDLPREIVEAYARRKKLPSSTVGF
jgi:transposase InsO family protein